MNSKIKLEVELIPKNSWGNNLRNKISKKAWGDIVSLCQNNAKGKCEICDDIQNSGVVECHEKWIFDEKKREQILAGFQALCPNCHKVKHIGRTISQGGREMAVKHLMKVNCWSKKEADEHITQNFQIWRERSKINWELNLEKISTFFNLEINFKITQQEKENKLLTFIKEKKLKKVESLLNSQEGKALVNLGDDQKVTPILEACRRGNIEIVKLLIKKGADINQRCIKKKTILHYSVMSDNPNLFMFIFKKYGNKFLREVDCIKRLFFHGLHSSEGFGPLGCPPKIKELRKHMLEYIISHLDKELMNQKDNYGKTFLHIVARFGDKEQILKTINKGGPGLVNIFDKYGKTAINEAALANNLEAIEVLLQNGSKFGHETKAGETVYQLISEKNGYAFTSNLLGKYCDVHL